jgi:hypothetical protein
LVIDDERLERAVVGPSNADNVEISMEPNVLGLVRAASVNYISAKDDGISDVQLDSHLFLGVSAKPIPPIGEQMGSWLAWQHGGRTGWLFSQCRRRMIG